MNSVVTASNVSKYYGRFCALDQVNFNINPGQIMGLVGPNGAGKTSLLRSMLGLVDYRGKLSVLGKEPMQHHAKLMEDVCFIADVATLPKWLKVSQALKYMQEVHPNFDIDKAEALLRKTNIPYFKKIKSLSKGMVTQLHLSLVMAIDAKLLVLDEPTIGLDIIYRQAFYESLLNDYFNSERSIIVATHQIEEVEHILTDVMMINKGHVLFNSSMDDIENKFILVSVKSEKEEILDALHPLRKQRQLGGFTYLFETTDRQSFSAYGEISTPSVADVFVAKVSGDKS